MTDVVPIRIRVPKGWLSERLAMICILAVAAGFALMPFAVAVATWVDHLSLRREWRIEGPACSQVAEVPLADRGAKPPPPFVYKGARFAFQIGSVSCEAVPDEGWFPQTTHAVCQFSAPGAVEVSAGGRTTVFASGLGHPATITMKAGRPTCVVGGWFR